MEKLNKEGLLSRIELTKEMFEDAQYDVANALSNLKSIEREVRDSIDEKKYYVRLTDGNMGYLNIALISNNISMSDNSDTGHVKTTFTETEIKAMPNGEAYWLLREPVEGVD